jgi:hypothetical protein
VRLIRKWLAVTAVALVQAAPVAACPLCESETGQQVRAGVFGAEFLANLLLTALPFAVLLAVVTLIHLVPARPRPARSEDRA